MYHFFTVTNLYKASTCQKILGKMYIVQPLCTQSRLNINYAVRHSIIFPIQQRRQFALISLFILILCVEHYDQIILNILTGICTIFFSSCNSVKIRRKGYFVSIFIYVIRNTVIFHTFWIYYTRRGWTSKSINHFWLNRLKSWLNLKARTHYYYNLHKIY